MARFYEKKAPIRAALKAMEVGDVIHFPASRTSVVRSTASILNLETERKYTSRTNREEKVIEVTRKN